MTPTNINYTPKKYAGAVGLDRSTSPGQQVRTGWDTCPASLAPSLHSFTRKKHQAWRMGGQEDPGRKVKVCGFKFWSCLIVKVHHFHGFVIFIRSYSFSQVSIHQYYHYIFSLAISLVSIMIWLVYKMVSYFILHIWNQILPSILMYFFHNFPYTLSLGETILSNSLEICLKKSCFLSCPQLWRLKYRKLHLHGVECHNNCPTCVLHLQHLSNQSQCLQVQIGFQCKFASIHPIQFLCTD